MNRLEAQNRMLKRAASLSLKDVDDDTALELQDVFPDWAPDTHYLVGDRVAYEGDLYKVVQAHTSQADWVPDAVPALYTRIARPGEIPEWVQPTGAHDAYAKGDKVRHRDRVWESLIDGNVWEPGVYGWKEEN